MEVRAWFDGIRIEEAEPQYLEKQASKPDELIEPGNRVYRLVGSGWEGFIVGGIMSFQEDHEEFLAPSKLLAEASK